MSGVRPFAPPFTHIYYSDDEFPSLFLVFSFKIRFKIGWFIVFSVDLAFQIGLGSGGGIIYGFAVVWLLKPEGQLRSAGLKTSWMPLLRHFLSIPVLRLRLKCYARKSFYACCIV
ncbi:transmembrane protein, putative [Medicago truncatula]|uniref:Transmembrane protein, putative n=1 Tax=Medicago truncatula TaxID=3880 RepID=A0A072VMI8_MEDTR|nr:transmembrane protein, putative [Medicago truncatula]